jgi:hypothetical protein
MPLFETNRELAPINPVPPLSALVKKVLTAGMFSLLPFVLAAVLPVAPRAASARAVATASARIIEGTRISFASKTAPPRARRSRSGLIEFQ